MFNKEKIKWIAVFSALALLFVGVISALAVAINNKPDEKEDTALATVNDFVEVKSETTENMPVLMSLALSDKAIATYAADNQTTVSKSITATILPATAENTKVNWSVEWGDSQSGTVTDYITVTPESAGSTKATVTCKKAFSGNIVIVCTTQEGGYMATCTVTFVGCPTDFNVSGSIAESNDAYNLGIGNTYTYTVKLSNPFNSVGSQFNNVSASVTAVGQIEVGYMEHYNSSGNDVWYDTSYETIELESIKDKLISVSYADGTLTITTIKAIESYYSSTKRMDGGRTLAYNDKFHAYVSDCYFNVTLTEATSGLTKTMKIVFDEGVVTGVSISSTELQF